jgi:DNA-binding beta-propeller fold protein YncE
MNWWRGLASLTCIWMFSSVALAATLSGTVTDGKGTPIVGAIVSLIDDEGRSESVYSGPQGQYQLSTALAGNLEMRFRKRYHEDNTQSLTVKADGTSTIDAALPALTDAKALSDDHPSLSHFSLIDFDKDEKSLFSRGNFARDCLTCHQLGNSFTRWQRPAESWVPTVQRMHGYMANGEQDPIKLRAKILADTFVDGALATSRPEIPIDPMIATAKIYQWSLPGAVVPHDAEYHHANGHIYISEMFAGEVIEANLETGKMRHLKVPADGMPAGGVFARNGQPTPYGLTVPRAPHSLAEGPDGKFYMTDSIGSAVTIFDPADDSFESHDIEGDAVYPHTIRVDAKNIAWFSVAFSDHIGRFDPATKKTTLIKLPASPSLSIPGTTVPYGVAVSPIDGSIWYAKLASDKIGRIDPETLKVTEYDSPVKAPRRQRFDAAGDLWIAGFSSGDIARVDIKTMDAEVFPLPIYAPGEIAAPYALAVHPETQEVWVNDTMLDVSWRFLPNEKRFIAYPMPLRGTYTRDFTFTKEGWACTANNPIPAAALEGGVSELICIDPGHQEGEASVASKVASHVH